MMTPLAIADSLRIGSVDFVSPDEIKVLLDVEAPSDVALNAGVPRPFPRINSYVLIPSESGFLVAQIEWITIERSQYPKRKGIQDFGIVDLPFPLRKMSLNPLGVLREDIVQDEKIEYRFSRGVEIYPTVGDPVRLPSQTELKAIVESGENRRVKIGISPLAGNAIVSVDTDRLFGRHLAILGNTGSGKSCSVAGVIRWSIEAAKQENACPECHQPRNINSRFIILDPNGEYSQAFKDLNNVRLFAVEAYEKDGVKAEQLQFPLWLWNTAEWCAFTQASSKAQRPTLIQSLRSVREGDLSAASSESHEMRRFLRTLVTTITLEKNAGSPWGRFPQPRAFFEKIGKWQGELSEKDEYSDDEKTALASLKTSVDALVTARTATQQNQYPNMDFTKTEVSTLLDLAKVAHHAFGGLERDFLPIDADVPRPFSGEQFIKSIEANSEIMSTAEYVETMLMRIRTLFSDSRMKTITDYCVL